jgi:hypothetical protein
MRLRDVLKLVFDVYLSLVDSILKIVLSLDFSHKPCLLPYLLLLILHLILHHLHHHFLPNIIFLLHI